MSDESDLHHIVVVGGGAGGLELVTRLGDRLAANCKARVTLVDRSRTHLPFACHRSGQRVERTPGVRKHASVPARRPGTGLSAELHATTRAVVAYSLDKINPAQVNG